MNALPNVHKSSTYHGVIDIRDEKCGLVLVWWARPGQSQDAIESVQENKTVNIQLWIARFVYATTMT